MFKTRILYLVILIGAFLFNYFGNNTLTFLTFIISIVLPLLCMLIMVVSSFFVKASFKPALSVCTKNDNINFSISVVNKFFLPVSNAVVEIYYKNQYLNKYDKAYFMLSLGAFQSKDISVSLSSEYCGKAVITLKSLKLYDYLNIFALKLNKKDFFEVFIVPDTQYIDAQLYNCSDMEFDTDSYSNTKSGDDPGEIFDLHEYKAGDKLSRIHWKLSTKLGQTMVKDYSLPISSKILLLVELCFNRKSTGFPHSLDTVLETVVSVSQFLINNQIPHYIAWYSVKNECFREMKVSCDDDLAIIINKLLSAYLYENSYLALVHNDKINSGSNYSHVVYITSVLNSENLKLFSENQQSGMLSVFFASCLTGDEIKNLLAENEKNNVRIIPVKINDVKSSFDDLIL